MTTAPILAQPKTTSKNSALFLSSTATRAPCRTPAAVRACATCELRASSSAKVRVTDPQVTAGESGRVRACSRTIAASVNGSDGVMRAPPDG